MFKSTGGGAVVLREASDEGEEVVCVFGSDESFDIISDFRKTRSMIGLVPQELTLGSFDTVWSTVRFSRGLFGSKRDDAYLEQLLKDLSLFDKNMKKSLLY